MTRKDFVLIANVIRDMPNHLEQVDVAIAFANKLEAIYPNFNWGTFVKVAVPGVAAHIVTETREKNN